MRGRARGYHRDGETLVRTEQGTVDIVGAGDLVSTADDLARWDDALYDDHFLPVSLRAAMHTTYLNGKLGEVGYGWFFRTTADGHRLQFHGGSGAGFRAWNYRVEDLRLSVVVLSNVDEADGTWVRAMVDRIVTEVAAR